MELLRLRDYIKSSDRNRIPNRIALEQLIIALGLSILLVVFSTVTIALSALIAGSISAFSSWYAGRKIFNCKATTSEQFVQNVLLTESLKLVLVLALFCIVFALVRINFLVFITTYTLTLTAYGYELFKLTNTGLRASQQSL